MLDDVAGWCWWWVMMVWWWVLWLW